MIFYSNKRCVSEPCRGFTLTEVAIVLGIVGLIIGAIWTASRSVSDSSRATQSAQDILTISDNIRSSYTGVNQFTATGDQTTNLLNSGGIFPANLVSNLPSGPPVRNAWNGAVTVTFAPGGNNRLFRVSYAGTPADACVRIASLIASLGTGDAPLTLFTNTSNTPLDLMASNSTAIDIACQLNNGSATASTEFDFRIH